MVALTAAQQAGKQIEIYSKQFQREKQLFSRSDWVGPKELTCLWVAGWSSWSRGYLINSELVIAAGNLNTQQWFGDPRHSSNPAIISISFMSPLSKQWAWKRRLSFLHRAVHFILMIHKIHCATSISITPPKYSLSPVLQSCSFRCSWPPGQTISFAPWIITQDQHSFQAKWNSGHPAGHSAH